MAAFLVGLNKAGIKGISAVTVTFMAIAVEAKTSTGLLVPLLICGDVLAVSYYRKNAIWPLLIKLIPFVLMGLILGVLIGKNLPLLLFKRTMIAIILFSVIHMYWWEKKKEKKIPSSPYFSAIMGIAVGITTMLGNLAGAFANIFFLSMRIDKFAFIGTAAWLFFIINLVKLPFHIWIWGTLSLDSLPFIAWLIPIVVIGFITGVRLLSKIEEQLYRKLILLLTFIGALILSVS